MMGCGKTSAAINYMNEEPGPFIFVTPYLEECTRIVEGCTNKAFCEPRDKPSKLFNLHKLLRRGNNISSTHSLFSSYTEETVELIKKGHYTLVMDEAFQIVEKMDVSRGDMDELLEREQISIDPDTYRVNWLDAGYKGTTFQDMKLRAQAGTLLYYENTFLFWLFPHEVFEAFEKVIVLTYIFEAQVQKVYFDLYNIKYQKIGVRHVYGRQYEFDWTSPITSSPPGLKEKIHILQDKKLNSAGEEVGALSFTWYKYRSKQDERKQLTANTYNYFHNRCHAQKKVAMWATYKDWERDMEHRSYKDTHVSYNQRASNTWSHKKYLAYLVNPHINPFLRNYFAEHGCEFDDDGYALSTMIQWIWRSAIRNGEDIYIYVPSRRMRDLLENWIDAVTEGRDPMPVAQQT